MEYLIVFGYIACCVASWFVFASDWRRNYDVDVGDAIFMGVLSIFGPMSLLISGFIWLAGIRGGVVWRQK